MHVTGTARDLAAAFERLPSGRYRRDALVVALEADPDEVDTLTWFDSAESVVEAAMDRHVPDLLFLVVEVLALRSAVTEAAGALLESANTYASSVLGHDVTAIAVTVTTPEERLVAATSIGEFAGSMIDIGDGVVVAAHRLRETTLRDILLEEFL